MKQKLAVFDFDGTIIDGQSGALIVMYFLKKKMIRLSTAIPVFWWGVRYKLRLPHQQSQVRELIFKGFKGEKQEYVESLMRDFHDNWLVPLYRKDAIKEIERCQKEGIHVLIVSASFRGVVQPAAVHVGADANISTRMEKTEDSRYTGKMEGLAVEGPQKLIKVTEYANERYGEGNWEIEFAYGDHYSDLTLLASAKYPHAVDPDRALERSAKSNGWPILKWE